MAIAIVAHAIDQGDGNNAVTGAIDTTGASLLVAVVTTFAGSGTISDSKGNTWTPLTRYGAAGDAQCQIYYAENPTVGSGHTFTLTSTSKLPSIAVVAVSGAATSSVFDVENGSGNAGGVVNTRQPGSVTPSEDDELLVTGLGGYTASTRSIDSSFTILDEANTIGGTALATALAYKIQTSAGAENPTWDFSDGSVTSASIATFKADAGGGEEFNPLLLFASDMRGEMAAMTGGMRG